MIDIIPPLIKFLDPEVGFGTAGFGVVKVVHSGVCLFYLYCPVIKRVCGMLLGGDNHHHLRSEDNSVYTFCLYRDNSKYFTHTPIYYSLFWLVLLCKVKFQSYSSQVHIGSFPLLIRQLIMVFPLLSTTFASIIPLPFQKNSSFVWAYFTPFHLFQKFYIIDFKYFNN